MSQSMWLRFGKWPSAHDIDLVLDGADGEYERVEKLAEHLNHETGETMLMDSLPLDSLPLSQSLIAQAIAAAGGLPIDAFLSPYPDGFSVAAHAEYPYAVWEVGWRPTLGRDFFAGAVELSYSRGRCNPPP